MKKTLMHLCADVINSTIHLRAYKSISFMQCEQGDADEVIRIYRMKNDFIFNEDYAEYFDGLSYSDAELIFEGPISPGNTRKFTYIDTTAKIGNTYSYWMGTDHGDPTGPISLKVRDPEVWWSYSQIQAKITDLAHKYPQLVKVKTIGQTVQGRNIDALHVGNGAPCIALVGLVHAGESGPELILPALEKVLADSSDLLENISIVAVPAVNIDERERLVRGTPWYLRTNANGVDLNRNFPAGWEHVAYHYGLDSSDSDSVTYRGRSPGSEPETKALINLFSTYPVKVVFSFHCLASICGMSFLTATSAQNDKTYAGLCNSFADIYAEGMNGYALPSGKALSFGCSEGSLNTFCYKNLNIPAFDLEISAELEEEAYKICRSDNTDVKLLSKYQKMHADALNLLINKQKSLPLFFT